MWMSDTGSPGKSYHCNRTTLMPQLPRCRVGICAKLWLNWLNPRLFDEIASIVPPNVLGILSMTHSGIRSRATKARGMLADQQCGWLCNTWSGGTESNGP